MIAGSVDGIEDDGTSDVRSDIMAQGHPGAGRLQSSLQMESGQGTASLQSARDDLWPRPRSRQSVETSIMTNQ